MIFYYSEQPGLKFSTALIIHRWKLMTQLLIFLLEVVSGDWVFWQIFALIITHTVNNYRSGQVRRLGWPSESKRVADYSFYYERFLEEFSQYYGDVRRSARLGNWEPLRTFSTISIVVHVLSIFAARPRLAVDTTIFLDLCTRFLANVSFQSIFPILLSQSSSDRIPAVVAASNYNNSVLQAKLISRSKPKQWS